MKTVNCIMHSDYRAPTNLIHPMILKSNQFADAEKALRNLKRAFTRSATRPSITFLDTNMPGMNSWDYLEEYENQTKYKKSEVLIMMLSTSLHPEDLYKVNRNVRTFLSKPLTKETV